MSIQASSHVRARSARLTLAMRRSDAVCRPERRRARPPPRNCPRSKSWARRRCRASGLDRDADPRAGAVGDGRRHPAQPGARAVRLPESPVRQRSRERDAGQPVPAGRELSRLYRFAAARHAAGPVDLPGRRAPEPAVRRRRELGPDSAERRSPPSPSCRAPIRCSASTRWAARSRSRPRTAAAIPARRCRATSATIRRRAAEFEYGGFNQSLDWYVTGNLFREDGWRDDSPSRVGQIFGKLGWRNAATDLQADARLRRHEPHRQRPAGAALPRPRLRERLYQAGHHREPVDVPQPGRQSQRQRPPDALGQRLLPPHHDRAR